jgi:NCS2 family nucleobase:cation symporter-2
MTTSGHPVDAALSPGRMAAAALQHVLVMYAGAVALPLVVGGALRLPKEQIAFLVSCAVAASGIGTLLQSIGLWRFGIRLPVVMGVTLASLAPIASMAAGGGTISALFGVTMAAGVFAIVAAPFAGRLARYFTPLVTGTIVIMIGITLFRTGINLSGGPKEFADAASLAVVALTLGAMLAVRKLFDGFIASMAVLIALAVGFAAALGLGMVEFGGVRDAEWLAPIYPLRYGAPTLEPAAFLSLCTIMIVALVESTGMFLALGEICGRSVGARDIARGLGAVGLGAIVAGTLNSFPLAPSAANVGLVGLSGVRSRWAAAASGAMLLALGCLPKLGALVASLPQPVAGAAALMLFGMVAAIGIRILGRVDYTARDSLLVIGISIAAGMIPAVAPGLFQFAPKWIAPLANSGITLTALSALLLNALFNGTRASLAADGRVSGAESEP